jgi:hypothetical protein
MIKIPRLHYKNIETSDWDSLTNQYDHLINKMDTFGDQNKQKRDTIRAVHELKRNQSPQEAGIDASFQHTSGVDASYQLKNPSLFIKGEKRNSQMSMTTGNHFMFQPDKSTIANEEEVSRGI